MTIANGFYKLHAMKAMAVIAFFLLQLSMFACGYDIHVHNPVDHPSHLAQHQDKSSDQNGGAIDHACHIHASHVFLDIHSIALNNVSTYPERNYDLATLNLEKIPIRIEHPPKHLHS